jgi:hypothetical protein
MTLVARVAPFGCPLLLADILITTPQPHPQTQLEALPSIGHFALIEPNAVDLSRVAGLAQKICVITDNLAVGWSGNYRSARRIIATMRAYPWPARITTDDVQNCLATTRYEDQAAVSLAGMFLNDNFFGEFGLNSSKSNLPLFNECRILGGGKNAFIELCRNFSKLQLHSSDENQDYPTWIKATVAVLLSSSALVGQEMNNFGGLPSDFGGLFEILMFRDGKFAKLDDILYCFWVVLEHSKYSMTIAPHTVFVKVKYHGDILVVRRSDFVNQLQMHNMQFEVGPMAKPAMHSNNIRTVDLNAIHNCHYVIVRNDDAFEILAIANLFARDSLVRFCQLGDGRVSFAVKDDLLKDIHGRVFERFYGRSR